MATAGTFDGVHEGHRLLLDKTAEIARQQGLPMVVITYWPHPRIVLGKEQVKLLTTLDEKLEQFERMGIEHVAMYRFTPEFAMDSTAGFLARIRRDLQVRCLVIGEDHRMGRGGVSGPSAIVPEAARLGIRTEVIRLLENRQAKVSSSAIRRALCDGEVEQAREGLGRPYAFIGKVVAGDRIGRTMHYPTANLEIEQPFKLIPKDGVYAVRIIRKGRSYDGMMYIGNRPVLHLDRPEPRIEVFVFDFEGELYGESLTVLCYARLRDEICFTTREALQHQLEIDENQARNIFSNEHNRIA